MANRRPPMAGVVVSTTGLSGDDRERMHSMIHDLGGSSQKDFTSQVTHLISIRAACGSKYKVAARIGRPIMSMSWVTEAHALRSNPHFNACDDDFVMRHTLPVFAGLRISVTGMTLEQRQHIERIIRANGGTYTGDFTQECTHLIADKPVGEKYAFAVDNRITVVRSAWLFDSEKARACLDEAHYGLHAERDAKLDARPAHTAPIAPSVTRGYSLLAEIAETEEERTFDVSKQSGGGEYLASCTIYMSGISGERTQRLRRIIRDGFGTRQDLLEQSVTHVVIGSRDDKDVGILRGLSSRPHLVSPAWLIQCAKTAMLAPVDPYRVWDRGFPEWARPDPPARAETRPLPQISASASASRTDDIRESAPLARSNSFARRLDAFGMDDATQSPTAPTSTHAPSASAAGGSVGGASSFTSSTALSHQQHGSAVTGAAASSGGAGGNNAGGNNANVGGNADSALFSGMEFRALGLSESEVLRFARAVLKRGGLFSPSGVLTWSVPRDRRYLIVPFEYVTAVAASNEITMATAVSPLWLRECLERKVLLNTRLRPTFTPCTRPPPGFDMEGVVLSVSGYEGGERDGISALASALGASYTERFTRTNTHLVCASATGEKYARAVAWGVPAVSIEWLHDCARQWSLVPVDDYLLASDGDRDSNVPLPASQLFKSRPNPVIAPGNSHPARTVGATSGDQHAHARAGDADSNDSVGLMRGGRPAGEKGKGFRPSFETDEAMTALVTPDRNGGKGDVGGRVLRARVVDTPGGLGEMLHDTLQRAVKRSRATRDQDADHHDGDEQPPSKRAAIAFTGRGGPSAAVPDVAPRKGGDDSSSPPRPLEGFSIHVSTSLKDHRNLCVMVCSMGGVTAPSVAVATHLVARGKQNSNARDIKAAKAQRKKIVAPEWLFECERLGSAQNEALFPHTLNPKMSLSPSLQLGSQSNEGATNDTLREVFPDAGNRAPAGLAVSDSVDDLASTNTAAAGAVHTHVPPGMPAGDGVDGASVDATPALEMSKRTVENLERLLNATKHVAGGARRRNRRSVASASANVSSVDAAAANGDGGGPGVEGTPGGGVGASVGNPASPTLGSPTNERMVPEERYKETVTYDDPVVRGERRKMRVTRSNSSGVDGGRDGNGGAATAAGNSASAVGLGRSAGGESLLKLPRRTPRKHGDALPLASSPGGSASKTRGSVTSPPRFLLSAMKPEMKDMCTKIVLSLGGTVMDLQHFSRDCTHLVVGTPSKAEKYLAACATGKWVLRTSFLTASRQAGKFVPEGPHEWSADNAPDAALLPLVSAPRQWRLRIAGSANPKGAFDGWRVILSVAPEKHAGFHSLLTEGGAVVVGDGGGSGRSSSAHQATHAFIDASYEGSASVNISGLANRGVLCLRPDFIAEFIMQGQEPPYAGFLVGAAAVTADVFSAAEGRFRTSHRGAAPAPLLPAAAGGDDDDDTKGGGTAGARGGAKRPLASDGAPQSAGRTKRKR